MMYCSECKTSGGPMKVLRVVVLVCNPFDQLFNQSFDRSGPSGFDACSMTYSSSSSPLLMERRPLLAITLPFASVSLML